MNAATAPTPEPLVPHPEQDTSFNAYAVTSRTGPHVTTQAGVLHAGRFWTTTSSTSLKRRSVEQHGVASAVVPEGDRTRIVAGRTTAARVQKPLALASDVTAPLRAPGAIVRLGITQAEQLLGYVEASRRIPADWLPHRRVLLITRLDRSMVLDGFDVVEADGDWAGTEIAPRRELAAVREEGLDGSPRSSALPRAQLRASHRPVVQQDSRVHVGVQTPTGPIALPARWLGENLFVTSASALALADAGLPGPAVAVFDESTSRRPDEKLGVMFRGRASVDHVEDGAATLRLRADRITTWDGFDADTVDVER